MTTVHSLAHVFGWTLIHLLWEGTLLALMLACVLSLFARASAQLRYALSCLALIAVLAAMTATFYRVATQMHETSADATLLSTTIEVRADNYDPSHISMLDELSGTVERFLPTVLVLWSTGFFFYIARLNFGLARAQRICATATQAADRELAIFRSLIQRMNITHSVRLLHSDATRGPAVIGWLRPVVLIPIGASARLLSTQQLEAVLAHELAHIRRHDYLVNLLQSIVESLLFYHPAVWWISQQIRKERELCCDDLAVAYTGDRVLYARALYQLAEQNFSLPAVTLNATGGFLTMRIKRLLNQPETPVVPPSIVHTAFALVALAAGVGFGTAQARTVSVKTPAVVMSAMQVRPAIATVATDIPMMVEKVAAPAPLKMREEDLSDLNTSEQSVEENKPVQVKGGVMAGQLVKKTQPEYPSEARAKHVQGAVVLKAVIAKDGTIKSLQVESGPDELRTSAMDAVKQWVYKPYLLNGQPTEVETEITVNYHIGGGSADLETKIGTGDLLTVNVYGSSQYSPEARVSTDGTIDIPLAGTISVIGLSVRDAERAVAQRLINRNMYINPRVTIQVASRKI